MSHSSSSVAPRSKDQETLKEDPGKPSSVDNDNRSTEPTGCVQSRDPEAHNTTLANTETPERVESIERSLRPEQLLQEIEARKDKLVPHLRKDDDGPPAVATGVAHDVVQADAAATSREQAEGEKVHGIA